jgi:hypothetical protein
MQALRLAAAFLFVGVVLVWRPETRAQGPAAGADRTVPFKVGETLTYDVSWSTFLTAGTATMSVKERRPVGGAAVYDLVAEGRPGPLLDKLYHLYYKAESLLDTRTLQPSVATIFSDERGRTKLRTVRFTGRTTIEYEPKANAPSEKRVMPALSQDPLSAIYVIRVLPLKAGQVFTMPVVDGTDVYNARWQIAGPEPITTPAGAFSAWRLTPALSDSHGKPITNRRVTLWLSNDARRLPLKVQAGLTVGNFVLTLSKIAGQ